MKLGTINDLSQLKELLDSAPKVGNRQQSAKSKPKPVKQKADKNKGKTQKTEISEALLGKKIQATDKKLESVTKMADEYIYSRERKAKYAKEIVEAAEQKDVALNVLNHLRTEFTKRSGKDEPKVNRFNLFKLAVAVGAKSFADEEVKSTLSDLLHDISERCQKDFIRFETQKEDFKDDFIVYLSSVRNEDMTSFMHGIYEEHARKLYGKLNEDFRPKYNEWLNNFSEEAEAKAKAEYEAKLKKEAERKRKAEEKAAAKAKDDDEKKDKTKKDKTKTAEDTSTPTQPKKGAEKMTEEKNTPNTEGNIFTPSEEDKKVCETLGIKWEDYKNADSLHKAIDEAKEKAKDAPTNTLSAPENGENNKENNGSDTSKDNTADAPKDNAEDKGLNIDGEGSKAPATNEDEEWFVKKRKYYDEHFLGKEGYNYQPDETVKNAFAAHISGGYIHYASKDNVTVSKESGLTVFEVLVTEDDNKGRAVNFGPNLEHKQAVLLLAACLIHDNPPGNNPPKLTVEDLAMLKEELKDRKVTIDGKEVPLYDVLAPKLEKYKEVIEEKVNTDTKNYEPKAFDEETKGKIKEALEDQYKLSALEDKGADKAVTTDKDGNPIESEYDKLKNKKIKVGDKEVSEKEFLAEKFKENPGEVRAIVKDLINEKTGRKEEEATIADRVEMVRLKSRAKGDDKNADGSKTEGKEAEEKFRANRLQKLQEEMKIALGIIKKDGKKALEGEELEKYIKDNNITAYTYGRLGGQDEEIAKKCIAKEGENVWKNDFDAGKQRLADFMSNVKEGGRS